MNALALFAKRVLWPGPDFSTRSRYSLRKRFLEGPDVSTLDIGCGNGCMTIAAAMRGGSALGITVQPEFIGRAEQFRNYIGVPPERCTFKTMSIYELADGPSGQFDQIILFEVLEHLYHDELAISICARHLKKDGWLHVSVPNRDSHVHFEGVARTETGAHVRHGYDFATLEALLRRHGLEPVERAGAGGLGTVLGFLAVVHAAKLLGILGRAASAGMFFVVWPLVKVLDLLPSKPFSLYVLAAKREQRPVLQCPERARL
jgi:SAM-dependent methyltransferase